MPKEPKTGILLTAFGSTRTAARETYAAIDAEVARRYPELPRRWGYTSGFVRRRLAGSPAAMDSLPTALSRLLDDGVTDVAVQSIHVIAGGEFGQVTEQVDRFRYGRESFRRIAIGLPILADRPTTERAMRAMLAEVADRQATDAVLLMGHGTTHHPGDLAYTAADAVLRRLDPRAMLATIEGYPTFAEALAELRAREVLAVHLLPFVAVAGMHVHDDMAGAEPASWCSQLRAAGIEPRPSVRGCGDVPGIREIWYDHLAAALGRLADTRDDTGDL